MGANARAKSRVIRPFTRTANMRVIPRHTRFHANLSIAISGKFHCIFPTANFPSLSKSHFTISLSFSSYPEAVVGLERTSYTVPESDEVVEICINAAGANTDCPSSDPFQLTLSTADQTAGTAIDSDSKL